MPWQIVNTLELGGAPEAVQALQDVGTLTSFPAERDTVLRGLGRCHAYLASASVQIDDEFLDAAPNLTVIGSPSTGTDHLDLPAIRRRGITVFDIATEFDLINSFSATAEHAFGLLLCLNRRLRPACAAAEQGIWAREQFTGFQLLGKTLGILGLGRLGKISARIGQGFGMRVIAHDVRDASCDGVDMVGLPALLAAADVLTVHVHLTSANIGLVDAAALSQLRPGAILINTSRGRIVDEAALLSALRSGHLGGAALDVVDGEWLSQAELHDHPLVAYARDHENLLISPHIGGATTESIYGARVFMARKIADFLRTQPHHANMSASPNMSASQ